MQTLLDLLPLAGILAFCVALLAVALFAGGRFRRKRTAVDRSEPVSFEEIERLAREIHAQSANRAVILVSEPTPAIRDPKSTIVGGVRALPRGREWPRTPKGEPMAGLAQFNLRESPYVPDELRGIAFVADFIAPDGIAPGIVEVADESEPEPVVPPRDRDMGQPCHATFREVRDIGGWWPALEDMERAAYRSEPVLDALRRRLNELDDDLNLGQLPWYCKIGGMPAPVQDDIARPLSLQIGYDPVAEINLVDAGCLYLWRKPPGVRGKAIWDSHLDFY